MIRFSGIESLRNQKLHFTLFETRENGKERTKLADFRPSTSFAVEVLPFYATDNPPDFRELPVNRKHFVNAGLNEENRVFVRHYRHPKESFALPLMFLRSASS